MRILIVDDSPINLMVLKGIVTKLDGVEVETFSDPRSAIAACEARKFDVILADYVMPEIDGIGLIKAVRALPGYELLPIVMITTADEKQTCIRALESGASDFITKPIEPVELKARLRNQLAVRGAQLLAEDREAWLSHQIDTATMLLKAREQEMMSRLTRVIDERDWEAAGRIDRMAEIAWLIAGDFGLPEDRARDLRLGCTLYGSGTLDLREPAPPPAPDGVSDSLQPVRIARVIAASRHERWDGTGLPGNLATEQIPLEGRIAAVAEAFVSLTSDRVYGAEIGFAAARHRIVAGSGRQFDPTCVAAFERCWEQISALTTNSLAA